MFDLVLGYKAQYTKMKVTSAAKRNGITTMSYLKCNLRVRKQSTSSCEKFLTPGIRFSQLPLITGPVKLFCFLFQMGVLKGLKMVQ